MVSVLDVDPKESEPEDDAHGCGHAQDGVDRRLHPRLLHPLEGAILRRLGLVVEYGPGDGVAPLHVEGAGDAGVLSDAHLLSTCTQGGSLAGHRHTGEQPETDREWCLTRAAGFGRKNNTSIN